MGTLDYADEQNVRGTAEGLYLSGFDVTDMPFRQKVFTDGALPSGNGIAASCLYRLSVILDRDDFRLTQTAY
jgi:uncharacterized protein YyaL (SSP411 family)